MAVLVCFYLLFPALVIYLCMRSPVLDKIGAVLICYIAGAVLGNAGMLPPGAAGVQDSLSSAAVAIALPLLLFSLDVRAWVKTAGKAILSMTAACMTVVAMAGAGSIFMADRVPEAWKLAGLAIGVYTGGTPNMAAIKTALDVDATTYITVHTYDIVLSFMYIIFSITIAQRLLNRFLPRFQAAPAAEDADAMETEDIGSFRGMFDRSVVKGLALASVLSLVILGVSLGLSGLVPAGYSTAAAILMITTLGIAASFIDPVRNLAKTFQLGMYIILVFCLVVGSMASLRDMIHINWLLMGYIGFCICGSFLLHALFCRVMKIDTDTFIITSTAAICSPPFVPVVAAALNNRQIILSGLTTGIIGYAAGNYLGISFAYLFKSIAG